MKPTYEDLMKDTDYRDAFHMYFQYVGRNKRYANIYKRKMEKIEKALSNETV
jgi:cytochrome b involved in lipid metabolism